MVASNEPGFTDVYSAIKTLTGSRTRSPFFDPSSPTKVEVQSDTTAVLSCKVHFVGNFTVSNLNNLITYLRAILYYVGTFYPRFEPTQIKCKIRHDYQHTVNKQS